LTRIYLIRHAEADGYIYRRAHGQFNGQSTSLGYTQIECLSKRFEDITVDAIYSSDLDRTCITATALSIQRDLDIIKTPMLREVNIGIWEDLAWGDLEHNEPEMTINFGKDPASWSVEGSERYEDVQARMFKCLSEIGARHSGETVAVFSHGFSIRSLICFLLDVPSKQTYKVPYCDNSAVALLIYDNGVLTIDFHGDNSHLNNETSTFARQTWWRNEKEIIKENLRYTIIDSDSVSDYSELNLPEDYLQVRADTVYIAFLSDEVVGLMGLDYINKHIGSIKYIYVKPIHREKNYYEQLIGQAISKFRNSGISIIKLEYPIDNNLLELYKKHGFSEKIIDGNKVLSKII
jgi:probable phosphoglycerate mutase